MTIYPDAHALGRIDVLDLGDTPALSQDVVLDVDAVQAAWPGFEGAFDSLQGRKMMGLVFGGNNIYRLSSVRLDRDDDNPLGLDETTIPGGLYLRLRLRGNAPEIYEQISPAFDVLFALADHDSDRPHIEYYKREGRVDCLVPILPAAS
ncbi:GyrI-like domain-containing protein [Pseudoclavibacter helvolus]|uniref:GyrI-like domain-containing protein n=1 Tax=Pseudoclavibacter helvolus TaxID=255205 RepID=UPI000838B083|nr:GyrI-like domain-containing protein [Pseudoclavibacter helvolus]